MQKTIYTDQNDNSAIIPLLLSIVLHGIVLAVIALWHSPPKISEPVGMQTFLVGEGEFAEIEGLLQGTVQVGTENAHDDSDQKVSSAVSEYNAELAARQAAYEEQMAKFAAELDAEMAANQQAYEDALAELAELQRQEVLDAKRAEQNQDEIVKQNQAELNKAREERDERIAAAEAAIKSSAGKSGSMSDAKQNKSQAHSGTGATRTTASSAGGGGSNANNIASAIANHIYPNWDVPSNAKGERLPARIEVDAQGNVISISISGGSPALRDSLERAIRRSSPLTPVVGTEHRRLTVNFIAN